MSSLKGTKVVAASESPPTAGRPTFSLSDLAALLQVNRNTVSAWVKRGCPYVCLAQRFEDHRDGKSIEHSVEDLVKQRVMGIVLGLKI